MLNKKQCRVILASGLMVGASMMFASAAKAGDDPNPATSNGVVTGTIERINRVTYTQPSTATVLGLTGTTDMNFGSLTLQSNDFDGWTLEVSSENGSKLEHASGAVIAYTGLEATAVGSAPTPNSSLDVSTSAATIASPTTLSCATVGDACGYSLTADLGSTNNLPTGNYTDTLTFTLTAK